MQFDCRFSYFPQPFEPELYLREYEIDVVSGNEAGSFVAARLALDFLDIRRIEAAGESVLEVCDADSAGWVEVFHALFEDGAGELHIKEDLDFYDPINSIVYLHRFVFGPSMRAWREYIVAHAAAMFPHDTAVVMRKDQTEFSQEELTRMGFWSIGGTDFLFRPNTHQHPYDPVADERDVLDADSSQFDEAFVNKQWSK